MTIENVLSHFGMGSKLTERYSEYTAPMQDQHIYYGYEHAPTHGSGVSSKHGHGGGGLKSNASMSALTLLAFLFFLHILQQCIKDHMTEMSSTPIMVMTAGREGENDVTKKVDKGGEFDPQENPAEVYRKKEQSNNMMRIKLNAADYTMNPEHKSKYVYEDEENKKPFPGFVSAMDNKEIEIK